MPTKRTNCSSCQSEKLGKFPTEMNLHFSGFKNLTKPTVMIFPEVVVCLNCGFGEFILSGADLRKLKEGRDEDCAAAKSQPGD